MHAKILYLALKRRFAGFQNDYFGLECVLMVEKWFDWFITRLFPNQSRHFKFQGGCLASWAFLHAKITYLALKRRFAGFESDLFGLDCVLMVEEWIVCGTTQLFSNQSFTLGFNAVVSFFRPFFLAKIPYLSLKWRFIDSQSDSFRLDCVLMVKK